MTPSDIFTSLGGGVAGLLGAAVLILATWIVKMYEGQLREYRATIVRQDAQLTAQTAAINRLADYVEARIGQQRAKGAAT